MHRRVVYTVIGVLLTVVAVVCGVFLTREVSTSVNDMRVVERVREQFAAEPDVVEMPHESDERSFVVARDDGWAPEIDDGLLRRIDFEALQTVAPDATRWMWMPDSDVDAPVVQESIDGEWYYSQRDVYGNGNSGGSFLVPASPSAHLVILGHAMPSVYGEWMFSHLQRRFSSRSGADERPYLYVYYPDHSERWRVWAAVDAAADDMIYDLGYELGSDAYGRMIEHVVDVARYCTEDAPSVWSPLLMLSTCQFLAHDGIERFAVFYVPDESYWYDTNQMVDELARVMDVAWRRRS